MTETLARPITLAGPALLSRSSLAQRDRLTAGFPMRQPGPGSLPLNGGVPAPEALPIAELSEGFRAALADPEAARTALQYSVPLGIPELRQWIAHRESVDPDRVVVTNGALHALSLTFGAILDPGDVVIVENPTFPIALRVLQYHNAHIRSVPVDSDGLDVGALERALIEGVRPKAVYTIPDFHNPTGVTLSAARRVQLVELAERYGFVIVSDSPYQELRFTGEAPDGITVESDLVVRANTFSKTLGPGLRLGWAVLPKWLVPGVGQTRQNYDQHASLLTQRAVTRLLEVPGQFDRIAGAAAENYRVRAETLAAALESESAGLLRVPAVDGGIFLWAQVQDSSVNIVAAHQRALAIGTDFQPGHHFDSSGAGLFTDHLRFGFTALPADRLPEAAVRVAKALLA